MIESLYCSGVFQGEQRKKCMPDNENEGSVENPEKMGLRDFLARMFPITQTIYERHEFIGRLGKWVDWETKLCANSFRYIGLLSLTTVYRVGVIVGGLLFVFFIYLTAKGFNTDIHTGVVLPEKILRASGIMGLYVYYYTKIMSPVIFVVASLCFGLFLIHARKGDFDPFTSHHVLKFKDKRTLMNKSIFFIQAVLMGWFCYYLVQTTYIPYLAFASFLGTSHGLAASFFGLCVSYIALLTCQVVVGMFLYVSLAFCWMIIFQYDKAAEISALRHTTNEGDGNVR
jgi:hypothetical protein